MWIGEKHMASLKVKKKKNAFRPTYFPPSDSILFPFDILIMVQKFIFFNHWVLERIEKLAKKRQVEEKSIGWLYFSNKQSSSWC
jgi:hypothetical protein